MPGRDHVWTPADGTAMSGPAAAPRRWVSWLAGCAWSAGIHSVLLGCAFVAGIWLRFPQPRDTGDPIATELPHASRRHFADMSVEPAHREVQAVPLLSANALQDLIRQEFQDRLRQSSQDPVVRQSERLEELASRLQSVSSATGIQEMTGAILGSLGAPPRPAAVPSAASPAVFDHRTAQIDDVLKSTTNEGTVTYVAVLIDTTGRTLRVELDQADGEQLFRIFEAMRQFPLLHQVYRELAMPLLDHTLQTHPHADDIGGTTRANGPRDGTSAEQ